MLCPCVLRRKGDPWQKNLCNDWQLYAHLRFCFAALSLVLAVAEAAAAAQHISMLLPEALLAALAAVTQCLICFALVAIMLGCVKSNLVLPTKCSLCSDQQVLVACAKSLLSRFTVTTNAQYITH